MIMKKILEN